VIIAPVKIRIAQYMYNILVANGSGIINFRCPESNISGKIICTPANGQNPDFMIEDDDYMSLVQFVESITEEKPLCFQKDNGKIICSFSKRN
jgi:hypothetical protein